MIGCIGDMRFLEYFNKNMDSLGLPGFEGIYMSAAEILAAIAAIAQGVDAYGRKATLADLLKKKNIALRTSVGLGVLAAFWVGAAIGSFAVAAGRSLGCGATIGDVIWKLRNSGVNGGWVDGAVYSDPRFSRIGIA